MKEGQRFVILLRHGLAEELTPEKTDAERELTEEGRRKMKKLAKGLYKLFPKNEVIVSSPLRRAVQSAEWISKAYGDMPVEIADALAPDSNENQFRELLESVTARRAIFVGHEPMLSILMLTLAAMAGEIELEKGGCYGVRIEPDGSARLEWMLPPRVMKK